MLTDGQIIRHNIPNSCINRDFWYGVYHYNKYNNEEFITRKDEIYVSLVLFTLAHIEYFDTRGIIDWGWDNCKCEVNGEWLSLNEMFYALYD